MQKVQIYVGICGDYCAFHEMSFEVVYDVTNNIQFDDEMTLEKLGEFTFDGDYCDYELVDGYLIDGQYYYSL